MGVATNYSANYLPVIIHSDTPSNAALFLFKKNGGRKETFQIRYDFNYLLSTSLH
jgi:hypothetical protein